MYIVNCKIKIITGYNNNVITDIRKMLYNNYIIFIYSASLAIYMCMCAQIYVFLKEMERILILPCPALTTVCVRA